MRREGLSGQFAIESIAITLIFSALAAFTGLAVHPVLFLIILYLITMRVRLLVDLGNSFARRSSFETAEKIYSFASRLWPDRAARLIIEINQGTLCLQKGLLDEAIGVFKSILEETNQGHLGAKYESAAHYNLGQAYRRKNLEAQAIAEFNTVLDTWPASEYAHHAAKILAHSRQKIKPSDVEEDTPDKP
jgi:tetratricopeptide (TPR) repeat protein